MTKAIRIQGLSHSTVPFSMIEVLFKSVVNCQRSHEDRVWKADYLHQPLFGDQLVFNAVDFEGKRELLDGYTRCESIRLGLTPRPEAVVLMVHKASNKEQVVALYEQFNNAKAAKKGGDRVQEGLRLCGAPRSLMSAMVGKGPTPTAVVHASGIKNVREAVCAVFQGLQFVDSLGLERGTVTGGQLAAFVAIAQRVAEKREVESFIRKVTQRVYRPGDEPHDFAVTLARNVNQNHRDRRMTSGVANVNRIRDVTLQSFVMYQELVTHKALKTTMGASYSLAQFVTWAENLRA